MRALVQRVARAEVRVDGASVGAIGPGLLVLVGAARGDAAEDARRLADKISALRIFEDEHGRMQHDVRARSGEVLVVSQFTLLADVRRGNRPSFTDAAAPEAARALVEAVVAALRAHGLRVAEGVFGARMLVESTGDGPVTICLDTRTAG